MTAKKDYFCARCSCARCTAERRGSLESWPRIKLPSLAEVEQIESETRELRQAIGDCHAEVQAAYNAARNVDCSEATRDQHHARIKSAQAERAELQRRIDQNQVRLEAIPPSSIRKLMGRLGLGPVDPRLSELSDAWSKLAQLDRELTAIEKPQFDGDLLRGRVEAEKMRLRDKGIGTSPEVLRENVRKSICDDVATSILPIAKITPFQVSSLIRHPGVSSALRDLGHVDLVDSHEREFRSIEMKPENARRVAFHVKNMEETDAIETLSRACHEQKFSRDSSTEFEEPWETSWRIPGDTWMKAFILLAIKHREPGFIFDEIDRNGSELLKGAEILEDDRCMYAEEMLGIHSALAGEEFRPDQRAANGHLKQASETLARILRDRRTKGLWQPHRGAGAAVDTVRVAYSEDRHKISGDFKATSVTFAGWYQLNLTLDSVFKVAGAISSE